jgi:hypothetical protein
MDASLGLARENNEMGAIKILAAGVELFPSDFLLRAKLAKRLHFVGKHLFAEQVALVAIEMRPEDEGINETFKRINRDLIAAQETQNVSTALAVDRVGDVKTSSVKPDGFLNRSFL